MFHYREGWYSFSLKKCVTLEELECDKLVDGENIIIYIYKRKLYIRIHIYTQ